jgi:hypothetical protein
VEYYYLTTTGGFPPLLCYIITKNSSLWLLFLIHEMKSTDYAGGQNGFSSAQKTPMV